ncbi:MAG: hypothetical protein M3Q22_11565 [Actinomycetota bacterium]|nr:hypothetical protein [Actinomycetota bacterium]
MTGRADQPPSTVSLSTSERLVLGHLRDVVRARTGARVDLGRVAACVCLPRKVVDAAVNGLLARQLLHQHADGRVVVLRQPGGGGQR